MKTRYRMTINGTQLDECLRPYGSYKKYWDKIAILDIGYSTPEFARAVEAPGDGDGGVITRTYRAKASVTVTFGIYIYDTVDRYTVCQIIKSLAQIGGTISTSDRPGIVLENCVCEKLPEIESARDWTAPLTMTFSSYAFPYWQSKESTNKTMIGTKTYSDVYIPGNAPYAPCSVVVTAHSAVPQGKIYTSATLLIRVGNTYLHVCYPFKTADVCWVDYDANNNIRVMLYPDYARVMSGKSILDYVLAKSNDKLLAIPGKTNREAIDALVPVTATFKVKGAFL